MSNIALSWAYRCHVGNAPAKAILVYLADRASDDGTAAFPKVETIEQVTEFSHSTVRRSLKLLQERGFIRKGDQRYARIGRNGRDRLPQYCQIVWDLAIESDPATLAWVEETHASEYDPATMGDVDPTAKLVPVNRETKGLIGENVENKPVSSGVTVTPLENTTPEDMGDNIPAVSERHPQQAHSDTSSSVTVTPLHIKEETIHVNPPSEPFPSAPSGHLPASGATAGENGIEPDDGELDEAAGRILDALRERRSERGLTTPEPTVSDRRAVIGLYRRLVDSGESWPVAAAVTAIGFAMDSDWWPKRLRTGRQLARLWDELTDDMMIASSPTADAGTDSAAAAAPAAGHVHSVDCEHVKRIVNSDDARKLEPVQAGRLDFAGRVAAELNQGMGEHAATLTLLGLLRERHDRELAERRAAAGRVQAEREARKRELAALRERNGGSMFVGARGGRP